MAATLALFLPASHACSQLLSEQGFIYNGSSYTTIYVPGAQDSTYASGINDAGQAVGSYIVNGSEFGFLLSGGVYTTIDVPGSQDTDAYGINDAGQIIGTYYGVNGFEGFTYLDGVYTTLHSGFALGINNFGQIVEQYLDGSVYLYSAVVTTPLNIPSPGVATGLMT